MKTNIIRKLVGVALCGFALFSGNVNAQVQLGPMVDPDVIPLTAAELTEYAAYLGPNARATDRKPTKIAATQTSPQFVKTIGIVTMKARLMWLDKSDRRNPVWRPLNNRLIEFQESGKLRATARTNSRGWASGQLRVADLKPNPAVLPKQYSWRGLFTGDTNHRPSHPDGTGRFVVQP